MSGVYQGCLSVFRAVNTGRFEPTAIDGPAT